MADSNRIKLRDKRADKLKSAIEGVVVAHDGSFSDERGANGVKSTYERVVGNKTLRFRYVWHSSPSDNRSVKNTRARMHTKLQELKIQERLPNLKLKEGGSYEGAILAFRKSTKEGRAFLALEQALDELEASIELD